MESDLEVKVACSPRHLIVGGARGSFTVSGQEFLRYGGYTTSFLVDGAGDAPLLMDAGSGLCKLLPGLPDPALGTARIRILLSHFHLDHLAGLPKLPHLYVAGNQIEFVVSEHLGRNAEEVIHTLLSQPYWPFEKGGLAAELVFSTLPAEQADEGIFLEEQGLWLRWHPLTHPGGSTAFVLEDAAYPAQRLLIASDMEWPRMQQEDEGHLAASFLLFLERHAQGATALIDAQYLDVEYAAHEGWGHNRIADAVHLATCASAKALYLTHHDPARSDRALDAMCREGGAFATRPARQEQRLGW